MGARHRSTQRSRDSLPRRIIETDERLHVRSLDRCADDFSSGNMI